MSMPFYVSPEQLMKDRADFARKGISRGRSMVAVQYADGILLADMRGYAYARRDVTARGLANAYAQTLGTIFSSGGEKPYEVEIFVAEIGGAQADDELYRLTYDGQVGDEHGYAVIGGAADVIGSYLAEHYKED